MDIQPLMHEVTSDLLVLVKNQKKERNKTFNLKNIEILEHILLFLTQCNDNESYC